MPEYFFAISEMAKDENGELCDAYMKVDFPVDASVDDVMAYAVYCMPALDGKLRPVSREEYEGNMEEAEE